MPTITSYTTKHDLTHGFSLPRIGASRNPGAVQTMFRLVVALNVDVTDR
jgi:hypothetical protein